MAQSSGTLDPNRSTRREYTDAMMVSLQVPDDAAADWKRYGENLKALTGKLAYHDAMKPNIDQTYMTPAASKNKVYFMWDFVARTMDMLGNVPSSLEGLNPAQKEIWSDVITRSAMAKELILDTKPGMLDMMTTASYRDQGRPPPAFGDEILAFAGRL